MYRDSDRSEFRKSVGEAMAFAEVTGPRDAVQSRLSFARAVHASDALASLLALLRTATTSQTLTSTVRLIRDLVKSHSGNLEFMHRRGGFLVLATALSERRHLLDASTIDEIFQFAVKVLDAPTNEADEKDELFMQA
jgi:gluconate kinase